MENKEEKEVFRKEKGYAYSITCHHEGVFTVKDKLGTPMFDFRVEDNAIIEVCDHSAYGVATKEGAEIVWDFIREEGILPEVDLEKVSLKQICDNLNCLGLALSKDGIIYSVYDLPNGFKTIKGVPYLEDLAIPARAKIPDNLTVHGSLILDPTRKFLVAKDLKVGGKIFAKSLENVAAGIPDRALEILNCHCTILTSKTDTVQSIYIGAKKLRDRNIGVTTYSLEEIAKMRKNLELLKQVPFKVKSHEGK